MAMKFETKIAMTRLVSARSLRLSGGFEGEAIE